MKKYKLSALLLALILMLAGCGNSSDMREGMDHFMVSWSSGGEDAQFIGSGGELITGVHNEGLAALLMRKVEYKVCDIKDDTVILEIAAPDVAAMLEQAVASMDSFDADGFQSNMEALLEENVATRIFTVEVQMQEVDGKWYPILSAELVNAVTGGLAEAYATTQQLIIDSMIKGGNS